MRDKLSIKEYFFLGTMLFGLFFGAGNLIFPGLMGQMAGENVWIAIAGFIITGVGLPIIGVVAIAISGSAGLYDLSGKVSNAYGMVFTCMLYLTIGPLFAIPRCATVSYTVGMIPAIGGDKPIILGVFSLIFFLAVLWFSLRPSELLTWIGKILAPLFLIFLAILIIVALSHPMGSSSSGAATADYKTNGFFRGFIEGYNTMDALASLAFGIIVINSIKDLGVQKPKSIAKTTLIAGCISAFWMSIIYASLAILGAQSRKEFPIFEDGGTFLNRLADNYMGNIAAVFLAITITLACLKTAIGLITACSTTFSELFPNKLSYKSWAILFTSISFLFANFGLAKIISYSIPMLMLLYPLTIVIMLLAIFGNSFGYNKIVMRTTILFTLVPAIVDGLRTLPTALIEKLHANSVIDPIMKILPLSNIGMSWVVPSIIGFIIGFIIYLAKGGKKTA